MTGFADVGLGASRSTMRVKLSTVLRIPAQRAWTEVQTARLLQHIAFPLQTFEPLDPAIFPKIWEEGRYLVLLRFLGVLPIGTQWIVITKPAQGPDYYQLRDNGYGSLVSKWDHLIVIESLSASCCRYTDDVEVGAGWRTPFIWAFAQIFYRHRQRRWRALVAANFSPVTGEDLE